ncbi:MAG: hypothetical protein ACRD0U_06370, partial [Acidimicrobiales bacterium]
LAEHFPGRTCAQWVTDLTTHEHDIRTALGRPGARDSAGVAVGADFLVAVGLHAGVSGRGLPPLTVRAGRQSWTVGTGEPPAAMPAAIEQATNEQFAAALFDPREPPVGIEPVGTLEAPAFELFRALTGRRSAAQIRSLGWTVDPDPYLPAFQFGPFTTSPIDIEE